MLEKMLVNMKIFIDKMLEAQRTWGLIIGVQNVIDSTEETPP
jgi:hypothetical protein